MDEEWQYRAVSETDLTKFELELNKLAKEKWEVAHYQATYRALVEYGKIGHIVYSVIMKRKTPS